MQSHAIFLQGKTVRKKMKTKPAWRYHSIIWLIEFWRKRRSCFPLVTPCSTLCRPSVDCLHNLSEAGNSFHHTKKKCLSSILLLIWSLVPKFFAGFWLTDRPKDGLWVNAITCAEIAPVGCCLGEPTCNSSSVQGHTDETYWLYITVRTNCLQQLKYRDTLVLSR